MGSYAAVKSDVHDSLTHSDDGFCAVHTRRHDGCQHACGVAAEVLLERLERDQQLINVPASEHWHATEVIAAERAPELYELLADDPIYSDMMKPGRIINRLATPCQTLNCGNALQEGCDSSMHAVRLVSPRT